MSVFTERAQAMRDCTERHYNCAQSVLNAFSAEAGIPEETALKIASNFGGGMKRASVCGAVTGGLMVLGLFGVEDKSSIEAYYNAIKEKHEGILDCGDLLRKNAEAGGEKKPFCNAIVAECTALAETILKERGLL